MLSGAFYNNKTKGAGFPWVCIRSLRLMASIASKPGYQGTLFLPLRWFGDEGFAALFRQIMLTRSPRCLR